MVDFQSSLTVTVSFHCILASYQCFSLLKTGFWKRFSKFCNIHHENHLRMATVYKNVLEFDRKEF